MAWNDIKAMHEAHTAALAAKWQACAALEGEGAKLRADADVAHAAVRDKWAAELDALQAEAAETLRGMQAEMAAARRASKKRRVDPAALMKIAAQL